MCDENIQMKGQACPCHIFFRLVDQLISCQHLHPQVDSHINYYCYIYYYNIKWRQFLKYFCILCYTSCCSLGSPLSEKRVSHEIESKILKYIVYVYHIYVYIYNILWLSLKLKDCFLCSLFC